MSGGGGGGGGDEYGEGDSGIQDMHTYKFIGTIEIGQIVFVLDRSVA